MKWTAEAIWEAAVPLPPDFTVEILPTVDSTNSELMRRARAGQAAPVLLVAEAQTAGRGRLGRSWTSQPGDALTFSLGLPLAPADWSGLSLAVGASIAASLHPRIGLKWPNDLWLDDRKLGGILIETATVGGQRYVVVGVGINIGCPPAEGLATAPAGLQELEPGMDAPLALQRLAIPLLQAILAFEARGFAAARAAFEQRDVLRGRAVRVTPTAAGPAAEAPLEGVACGVNADGALLVQTAVCVKEITSAEVTVRPA
ncbi:MAG TPA: biotin--[acetyl-CoA-carboxylase] ligase [Burkholderiaceae bacterium]